MKRNPIILFLFIFFSATVLAQNITVTGRVISEIDREAVTGASVQVKSDKSIGTVTDINGRFSLSVPSTAKTLIFSYVGMQTVEAPVKPTMEIVLSENVKALEEVVVTGYQKIDRRLFTGSADRLKADEAKLDGISDVSRMLQGRVAGVSVQNVSGTFGAAPKMKVRGASSIYGNQSPLWVVDGVILEDVVEISADALSSGDATTLISSAVAGLNADDIENFQILKDASAAALYGARAMNGVIVITTKKGKKGVTSINYSGEFTMRLKPSYFDYNLMNSQQQMDIYKELEIKGWLEKSDVLIKNTSGIYGYMYAGMAQYMGMDENGKSIFAMENTPEAVAKYLQKAEQRNTDWFNELFQYSLIQNHSVSISSGSEKVRNYASLSMYHDPGWTLADKVNRFTGNFNTIAEISKTLSTTFSVTGSVRDQQAPGTMSRKANVVEGEFTRDFDINPFSYALNTSRAADPDIFYRMNYAPFNIKHELRNNKLELAQADIKLQGELSWKPLAGLDLNALGSFRYVKSSTAFKIGDTSNLALAYRANETSTIAEKNQFLYHDPFNPIQWPVVVLPSGGMYNKEEFDVKNYYARTTTNYNKTFNEKHLTNFLAGAEIKAVDRTKDFFNGYGYQWQMGGIPFTDYRIIKMMLEGGFDYFGLKPTFDRSAAAFATASYSYLGKYTLNATARTDGTNQLGKDAKDRWLPTWNVSGGWNAKEEGFLSVSNVISQLQIRMTYGMNANPAPSNANSMVILENLTTYRPDADARESQIRIVSNQNDDLTWEKQYEYNAGFDLGLWRNKISISLDAYNRKCFDLIAPVKTSGLDGQFIKWANYATMNTGGVEFSLGAQILQLKDFIWNVNLTFAYSHNEITDLKSNPDVMELVSPEGGPQKGKPAKGLYSLRFSGLTAEGFPKVINEQGWSVVGDVNFQETQNLSHLVYEGPIDAPYQGGLNSLWGYKNWKMNIFFTYQFGNVVRLDPFFKSAYSDLDVMPKEMKNRWVLPGDEKTTNIPCIPSMDQNRRVDMLNVAYNAYNYSTERVAKGSYIRLKEIFLTYDLPKNIVSSLRMNNIQLKLTATNIALLYADKRLNGQDPEFLRAGGVAMPNPRQFTLTLKVGL